MSIEQKIKNLIKRFGRIEYLVLYYLVKLLQQSKEGEDVNFDDEFYYDLYDEIGEIYEQSQKEANEIIKSGYLAGYKRDKNRLKEFYSDLLEFILSPTSQMNQMGIRALHNTLTVINNAYRSIPMRIKQAQLQVVNDVVNLYTQGNMTWQQAKQIALNRLADQKVFYFIDRSGKRWELDGYVEMGIRTGYANASRAGFDQSMEDRGIDLVYCSAHPGACPLCVPWEGQVLSRSGKDTHYPSVDDAISAGLFHPNCGHVFLEYIEGFSKPINFDSEENSQLYQNYQQQRYMERNLRKWKRREVAAISPEEKTKAKSYVKRWSGKIKDFTEENNLTRKRYREKLMTGNILGRQ